MQGIATALLVALLSGPSVCRAGDQRATPTSATADIQLSFKLDPRLAGPTYGGERWVSPPTYRGASAQDSVEVRASPVDARGRPTRSRVDWSSSDPEMVTLSSPGGEQVRIAVRRTGESTLTVTSGAATRQLTVRASRPGGAWQVTIAR